MANSCRHNVSICRIMLLLLLFFLTCLRYATQMSYSFWNRCLEVQDGWLLKYLKNSHLLSSNLVLLGDLVEKLITYIFFSFSFNLLAWDQVDKHSTVVLVDVMVFFMYGFSNTSSIISIWFTIIYLEKLRKKYHLCIIIANKVGPRMDPWIRA